MDLDWATFQKILYALGIGILIGLERSLAPSSRDCEKPTEEEGLPNTLLGVRTFSILSLGGFAAALLGNEYSFAAPVILAGLILFLALKYVLDRDPDPGITTEIAGVVCAALGALCYHQAHSAVALALIITILLALKGNMPKLLGKLKRIEFTDTLKFLVIILILLPLIPNRTIGPYDVFNPYKVTFLVILISGISFVGYFCTKFLGAQRGLGITGLFGGLTSSTAVTASMAAQAKGAPALRKACAMATVIANATMFARVLMVVFILDRALTRELVWSIGAMMTGAFFASIILWRGARDQGAAGKHTEADDLALSNPFSIGPALKFALVFVGILFAAKIAQNALGDQGLYLASLVSGLADVDPITLSIVEQTKSLALDRHVGAIGITIAVVSNSVVKSGIAVYSGGWKFGSLVGGVLLSVTLLGLLVLLVL
ncbi:Uncharacterized membrane protein, DUF4010 family [Desulfatibacillum alkenivorans DSM 16219]|jgi:uncharacterized membrane protein (DUF4010 family)|uniref:Uncharacterized membrane protein, DUF4010 family n=1 Tax=Desulfatibacillum alkenivorans DSM 16219 TaxID=1121393 RepID=A0A1M6MP90_9BACT|nr:MgtC/SapB family protein [Desulfatibacillum alkenivorans]SHJ85190.1 Uncharacterized membrane protein, DUF4010 family [Desulfatibacillum alkenivorans DSM 16219]